MDYTICYEVYISAVNNNTSTQQLTINCNWTGL